MSESRWSSWSCGRSVGIAVKIFGSRWSGRSCDRLVEIAVEMLELRQITLIRGGDARNAVEELVLR